MLKECYFIVQKEIAKKYWKEAKKILYLTSDEYREEFIKYYKQDKGNICCMVLDKAKSELIKEGKLILNKEDGFGKPYV
jgi:hypothetical protein